MSAEGVSETLRSINYYFCHHCSTHFTLNSIPNDDTTAVCPRCHMGFIEELPDPPPASTLNSPQDFLETINVLAERPSRGSQDAPLAFIGFPNFMQGLTNILSNFDGARGQQIHLIQPNPGMTMHSNPGDYVFGGGGIDAIVTQILNQPLDGVGPPPLDKELIKEIPTVKISREQVGSSLQCAVCWEDFVLDEPVRELKCDHFFHEQCIIPWLELHGTCPVCRKFQQEEQNKEDGSITNNETSSGDNTENTWAPWTNATDLNDVITSAIETVFRSVEYTTSPLSASQPPSSSVSTSSTGGNSSSSNGSGETSSGTNERGTSNSDISNLDYYDFDLE
nr:E3 ubiquitin-protein ligase RNF115-like [Lepeophtheirus salmonis]